MVGFGQSLSDRTQPSEDFRSLLPRKTLPIHVFTFLGAAGAFFRGRDPHKQLHYHPPLVGM